VARIQITKRSVDAIEPPPTGELKLWDVELRGFGLRVRAGGTKSYIVQYRNAEGRTRRLTVGVCGRLTPDAARSKARQMLAAVDRGEDPVQDAHENRRAPTVAEFAAIWARQDVTPIDHPPLLRHEPARPGHPAPTVGGHRDAVLGLRPVLRGPHGHFAI